MNGVRVCVCDLIMRAQRAISRHETEAASMWACKKESLTQRLTPRVALHLNCDTVEMDVSNLPDTLKRPTRLSGLAQKTNHTNGILYESDEPEAHRRAGQGKGGAVRAIR